MLMKNTTFLYTNNIKKENPPSTTLGKWQENLPQPFDSKMERIFHEKVRFQDGVTHGFRVQMCTP